MKEVSDKGIPKELGQLVKVTKVEYYILRCNPDDPKSVEQAVCRHFDDFPNPYQTHASRDASMIGNSGYFEKVEVVDEIDMPEEYPIHTEMKRKKVELEKRIAKIKSCVQMNWEVDYLFNMDMDMNIRNFIDGNMPDDYIEAYVKDRVERAKKENKHKPWYEDVFGDCEKENS